VIVTEAPAAGAAVLDGRDGAELLDGARVEWRARAGALFELTKPGITRLVLITAAAGFYLGSPAAIDLVLLVHALVGIALAASGSGALNQYFERDADARMRRTARRPLPSGRVSAAQALVFAGGLAAAGVAYLLVFVNLLTAVVVGASALSYIFVYTPLKRRTWLATVIGAVPGALPILAGWVAAGAVPDARAWTLFGILFLWQMPHFFALAWIYRDDYVRGGFRMLTAFDVNGRRTARQIVLYTTALLLVSVLPTTLGLTGGLYLAGATILGAAFLGLGAALALRRSEQRAWRLFFGSVAYLPALLVLMVIDKVAG
jgi:protoheme IX farnesyltransferase